ncbi:MAG: alpha/beta fold hydrolase [Bacteroidota bacterium]
MKFYWSFAFVCSLIWSAWSQETISFPSDDGLGITADFYNSENSDTVILLFHQAGWSRGEYKEIAPKLTKMGYSCLAVDLRSGGKVNGLVNQTHQKAKSQGKSTRYVDALQDIEASIAYVKLTYAPKKTILWGSSYSSALVLKYGGDHPTAVDGILSFAPGEYFGTKKYITESAKNIEVPVFITSAKNEYKNWKGIYESISTTSKKSYLPETPGNHGSRALWEKFGDHKGYWTAVIDFLGAI